MKTILWAVLSANGNYAQRYPPKEALEDFEAHVARSGNYITGRKTFELMQVNASRRPSDAAQAVAQTDIVVLSRHRVQVPGAIVVSSPREALEYLSTKGHRTALIAGGERTHNAFLAAHLVDELVLNIAPMLESEGLKIVLPERGFREVGLLGVRELGSGLVQLRYAIERALPPVGDAGRATSGGCS